MAGLIVSRPAVRATNVEWIDNGDMRPAWLSGDGVTVYSWGKTGLYTSTDDCETWDGPWHTFPRMVHGVRETADGELLVSVFDQQGFYAGLWRSTGWSASKSTATWQEVLTPSGQASNQGSPAPMPAPAGTAGDRSNYFTSWFGFHCYSNGFVVVNEYGKQANGTSVPGARYAFLSTDNGKPGTWVLLKDIFAGPAYGLPDWPYGQLPYGPASGGQHMHGCCYDPWADRFWVTAGDHGCHTEYSDDQGATWHVIPGSQPEFGGEGGQPGTTQAAVPYALPSCVVFGTDGPNDGLAKIDRGDDSLFLGMAHDLQLPHTGNLKYTGSTPFTRDALAPTTLREFPVLFPFYVGAGSSTSQPAKIVACDPQGERFYDIFTDDQSLPSGYGFKTAVGPTANGKLLASISMDGRSANQSSWLTGMTLMRADFPGIV